jgi:hypothetical protein
MTLVWKSGPGNLILKNEAVEADPFFNNVSLLLHGDGTNGSTTIFDSSSSPKAVTAVGDAQISTAQSKFGGSSIAFDGNGDYLTVTASSDFNFATGDYTIEAWIYPASTTFGVYATGGGGSRDQFVFANSTCFWDYPSTFGFSGISSGDLNQWSHVVVCRAGTTNRFFKNGIEAFSWQSSASIGSAVVTPYIGRRTDGFYQANGYIDELRITKGIARYTANFTPPTAPFPEVLG